VTVPVGLADRLCDQAPENSPTTARRVPCWMSWQPVQSPPVGASKVPFRWMVLLTVQAARLPELQLYTPWQ
jgi:hypothetical protein